MTDTLTGNTVSILTGGMLTTINLPAVEDVRLGVDRGDGTLGTATFTEGGTVVKWYGIKLK